MVLSSLAPPLHGEHFMGWKDLKPNPGKTTNLFINLREIVLNL